MREKLIKAKQLIDEVLESLEEKSREFQKIMPEKERAEGRDFLMLKSLLESDAWPEAVFKLQIADDNIESDKEERAEGIADIMLPPTVGKKFLDFGCGEGHVARYVSNEALLSVGYDLVRSEKSILPWEDRQEKFLLTTDFEKVRAEGPYDMILIYDVLDHTNDPASILSRAKSVLSDEGAIYVRCHPWCGRHGGHVYKSINKAFVHVVFTDEELKTLGVKSEFTKKITYPLDTYKNAIQASGLNSSEPEIDSQEVESFFSENPLVKSRMLKAFGITEWTSEKPVFQLSQCFVDYVLKK